MNAQSDETPTEPTAAAAPPPTGSPVGHLEPDRALATWRAMERSCSARLDVGMLWASKPADAQADAARPPVHGELRWLATLLPPVAVLATFETYGDTPAAAWISLAGLGPRFLLWSYKPGSRLGVLDVEVHEAIGMIWSARNRQFFGQGRPRKTADQILAELSAPPLGTSRPVVLSSSVLPPLVLDAAAVERGRAVAAEIQRRLDPTGWQRVDDLGVRVLCHRLAMFCMGDAVARPLRA